MEAVRRDHQEGMVSNRQRIPALTVHRSRTNVMDGQRGACLTREFWAWPAARTGQNRGER